MHSLKVLAQAINLIWGLDTIEVLALWRTREKSNCLFTEIWLIHSKTWILLDALGSIGIGTGKN